MLRIAQLAIIALLTADITGCAILRAGFIDPYDPPGRGWRSMPITCMPGIIPGTIDCV